MNDQQLSDQHTSESSPIPASPKKGMDAVKHHWFKQTERERLFVTAGALLILSGLWLGYFVGHRQGMSVVGASLSDLAKLNGQIEQQQATIDTLNHTLANTVQERDIALTTSKGLNESLAQQSADRAVTDGRLQAYRDRLLAFGGFEMTLQKMEVVPVAQNSYEFHVDLMQLRQKSVPLRGTLAIRLIQGATVVNVPVTDVIKLSDFQRLKGRWNMPAGFTPEFVEVEANAGGQTILQRFAWERGAPMQNTPQNSIPLASPTS